jgi:hypothetical protein
MAENEVDISGQYVHSDLAVGSGRGLQFGVGLV